MALTRHGKQVVIAKGIFTEIRQWSVFRGKEGAVRSEVIHSGFMNSVENSTRRRPKKSKSNEDVPISHALISIPILSSSKRRSIMKLCIVRTRKNDFT